MNWHKFYSCDQVRIVYFFWLPFFPIKAILIFIDFSSPISFLCHAFIWEKSVLPNPATSFLILPQAWPNGLEVRQATWLTCPSWKPCIHKHLSCFYTPRFYHFPLQILLDFQSFRFSSKYQPDSFWYLSHWWRESSEFPSCFQLLL